MSGPSTTPKVGIKYLLFDLTVVTILLAVLFQYLRLEDNGEIPIQQNESRQHQESIKANDDKQVQSNQIFSVGEIVELYDAVKSNVALPVVITEIKNSGSSDNRDVTYNLLSYNSKSGIPIQNVGSAFIHPYEVLPLGTEARCWVKEGTNPIPCTILSHHGKKGSDLTYGVSYYDEDEDSSRSTLILRSLSYERIQRRRMEVEAPLTKGEWLEKQRVRG